MSDLVKRLRDGLIEYRKRWSGDTHFDMGGSVDYDVNHALMTEAADALEALQAENARLREVVRLVRAADKLREEYHALPNDKNRIGQKESRKSRAKRMWLKAFGRAARAALGETT